MSDGPIWNEDPALAAEGADEQETHRRAKLEVVDARPPEYSDEALALRFAEKHCAEARYVAAWGKWLLWDGSRWNFDATMLAFDLARRICRVASAEVSPEKTKLAAAVASAKTVAAVANLARADRRLAAAVEQWDADPWMLNTPSGIVDLHNGITLPSDRSRFATKITTVSSEDNCPRWRLFLSDITGGDDGLQSFLQRVIGYGLTGITREHALFFLFGTGSNGKGTFINTIAGILGDYAAVAPMETFIASRDDHHPTDLAGLRGARLVTAQETEQGRRWAEAKIKALTGGDPITARFMRQDFFTYMPQFKLVIAGNHKPGLRGVDEAMRRRLHLIPFTVRIANPDRELPDKLRQEWPGILKWAIEGCLEWQRVGLTPPLIVRKATEDYLASEDAITLWLDERCVQGPTYRERSSMLFESWKNWAEAAGEFVGSQKGFTQLLEDRGFAKRSEPGTKRAIFVGLSLCRDTDPRLPLVGGVGR